MASGATSLNAVFGLRPGQTADLGYKVNRSGGGVNAVGATSNPAAATGIWSIPVVIAMGVILWFALHET